MEFKGSLQSSQDPTAETYPEPEESNPPSYNLFKFYGLFLWGKAAWA